MRILTGLAVLALAGCSVLPKAPVEVRYTLAPVAGESASVGVAVDASRTIRVDRTTVPVAYRGSQLVLLKGGEQTFYAGKAWEAPLPDLLDAALVRDLGTALPGWVVAGETAGVKSAYELQTDVRTFATVQEGSETAVVMEADVRLLDPASRAVLKRLPYRFKQPLAKLTTEATVAAYNAGWRGLVAQVAGLVR
jgi:ABC-type uncharacterized transport system auxiliary subunit